MIKKIGKDGFFYVLNDGESTVRGFKSEEMYKEWLEYTEKHGHDLISFYKISSMTSCWTYNRALESFNKE